jgi:hypothetical protein
MFPRHTKLASVSSKTLHFKLETWLFTLKILRSSSEFDADLINFDKTSAVARSLLFF